MSEHAVLPNEFKIKYILPLVNVDGLLFLSNERIYMQPFHPEVLHKPLINLRVDQITEIFKRRYTLMDLGLEIVA